MTEKQMWIHLLLEGEYPARESVFKGLKVEDAVKKVGNIKNSIYDELWHMEKWQNKIVLNEDEKEAVVNYKNWDDVTNRFPKSGLNNQEELEKLIESFLNGLKKAVSWCEIPGKLETKDENGFTIKDSLYSLAIHNAYHVGKIIAIRQQLGIWPPAEKQLEF